MIKFLTILIFILIIVTILVEFLFIDLCFIKSCNKEKFLKIYQNILRVFWPTIIIFIIIWMIYEATL